MSTQLRILIASHSPTVTTGCGRVTRELASGLIAAGHSVRIAGAGYAGEPSPQGLPIVPAERDRFGPAIQSLLEHEPADVLVTIGDPWMFADVPDLCRSRALRWMACFTIDATPLPTAWADWARAAKAAIVFSAYGERILRSAGVSATHLPHGVDPATFRPLDRSACKARVGVQDHFVVGTVAVNQPRKNLPALARAFARFAVDRPDALLYVHTDLRRSPELLDTLDAAGITDRTRATLNFNPHHGLSDADLALVYNSFDVFVLPTMAEGFGLPILEAQACGVPTLATDCSACTELLLDPMQRVPVVSTVRVGGFDQSLIDEVALADRLSRLYADAALRQRLKTIGHEFAATLAWPTIVTRWMSAIERVAAD